MKGLVFDIWTAGIDWKLPGNGGPECAAYLSPQRKILEFLIGTTLAMISLFFGWQLHSKPSALKFISVKHLRGTSLVSGFLLISMILTYLLEISYKLYTFQAVFIFNPCHCLCVVQMFILFSLHRSIQLEQVPNVFVIYLFR